MNPDPTDPREFDPEQAEAPSPEELKRVVDHMQSLQARSQRIADSQQSFRQRSQSFSDYLNKIHDNFKNESSTPIEYETPTIFTVTQAAQIRPTKWLVDPIIPAESLVFLYGREGCGKSFGCLDLAFSVATGTPFVGQYPAVQGPVLYCTAEGVHGLGNRIKAYIAAHPGLPDHSELFFLTDALALQENYGKSRLLLALHALLPHTPILLIIDTFHTYTLGADENSAQDMGTLISLANTLRGYAGMTVLFVHHTRKASAESAESSSYRGHSCLAGAADTMILIKAATDTANTTLRFFCHKQKDAAPFKAFTAELRPIKFRRGTASETSCYLAHTTAPATSKDIALAVIKDKASPITYTEWELLSTLPSASFARVRKELIQQGLVLTQPHPTRSKAQVYVAAPEAT